MEYSYKFDKSQVTIQDVWDNDDGSIGFSGFFISLGSNSGFGFSEGVIHSDYIKSSELTGDKLLESFFRNLAKVYEARESKDLEALNSSLTSIGLEEINHL